MKKLLLSFTLLLAVAGMTLAQDIYTAGYYTVSGQKKAAVYKNGEKIHESAAGNYDNTSTAVAVDPATGDVYWTRCNQNWGDVYKNGNSYLSQPGNSHNYLHDLYWYPVSSGSLISAGYRVGSDDKHYASIWRGSNTTPIHSPSYEDGYESEAHGVVAVKTSSTGFTVYYCGYRNASEGGSPRATVWAGDVLLYTLETDNSYAYDIAYFNGSIYTVGTVTENGATKLRVWRDDDELYTLVDSNANSRTSISIDAGDVYVTAYDGVNPDKVWKNGNEVYSTNSDFFAVAANSSGVYCAGKVSSAGTIWKDGNAIYTVSNCEQLNAICLGPEVCQDEDIRPLPFHEGFENGDTDWACWTKLDVDNANYTPNGYYSSFWDRKGTRYGDYQPHTGSYCAGHHYNYNGTEAQEGWLISPRLFLQPGRSETTLSFYTKEVAPAYMEYEGVWISTTNTSPSSFTEVWSQTSGESSWRRVDIDLQAYQGQAVYIAFKYTGTDAHSWVIDDISVTEEFNPCGETPVPFSETFDSNIGICWYNLDVDMSGGNKCWQYNTTEHCAYHPWGQQNTPQEGWLISKSIVLTSGTSHTLTFSEKCSSSGTNMKNSVLVSTSIYGGPNTNDFTEVWTDNSSFPGSWTTRTIDLTDYAGQTVYIAFKYEGTYAHNWYIDNISVEAAAPEYNVQVESNNLNWGTVTGGGTFPQGTSITISAQPNPGYEFLRWYKNDWPVSEDPDYTFTVNESAIYMAFFGEASVTYYTITTEVNPEGAGTVEGGNTYPAGATAYLTATANPGWQFSHWNDGITTNPRSVVVDGDATYTANFLQESYTLTVEASPAEGGTVTGGGPYHYGDMATLTATPNEGYTFVSWNDGITQSTRTVSVTGNATYTAIFSAAGVNSYTITVKSNNAFLGTVSGSGTYPEGSVITISAEASHQAHFVKWDDGNTDNPRSITVTQDATYTAEFAANQNYSITVESADPSMGTATGGGTFAEGTVITISAMPFDGFYFVGWNDGNAENPRNITVTQNATYKALFSQNAVVTYIVTVMCNSDQGSVIGNGTYAEGTNITIAAIPNSGFEFDKWNDDNTQNPRQVTVNGNLVFVAFFKGTGINDNEGRLMALYPNPANDHIRIEGLEANSEVHIYNMCGALVRVVNASSNDEIGIGDLPAGLYLVRCGNVSLRFVKTL